ncbi:MAG: acyl-ACP--UDP-N-acetylglucosamine O-acyltransferase [Verrucomicrobiota bacterium]
MPTLIHPTAIVEPGASLGSDCEIHPYAIIKRWATLGDRVVVHPFAVIGGDPQDLKFDGVSASYVKIGSDTKIRENVTINRGTSAESVTSIGNNCLIMAGVHVAHDCTVGNNVVLANAVLLAGHVSVGDHVVLGGASAFHQFSRIGERAMVGGLSRITQDIPPYTMAVERSEAVGLNLLGLKRSGYTRDSISEIKEAFRLVYLKPGNQKNAATQALGSGHFKAPETIKFLEFFLTGKRGFVQLRTSAVESEEGS